MCHVSGSLTASCPFSRQKTQWMSSPLWPVSHRSAIPGRRAAVAKMRLRRSNRAAAPMIRSPSGRFWGTSSSRESGPSLPKQRTRRSRRGVGRISIQRLCPDGTLVLWTRSRSRGSFRMSMLRRCLIGLCLNFLYVGCLILWFSRAQGHSQLADVVIAIRLRSSGGSFPASRSTDLIPDRRRELGLQDPWL